MFKIIQNTPQQSFAKFFYVSAGIASIIGAFNIDNFFPQDNVGTIYAYFMIFIIGVLVCYIYYLHYNKRHRYSEMSLYHHYVSHTIKYFLSDLEFRLKKRDISISNTYNKDFETCVKNILNEISQCFSLLTGKQCSVSVKEFDKCTAEDVTKFIEGHEINDTMYHHYLKIGLRDSLSLSSTRGQYSGKPKPHPLDKDLACKKIFYGDNGKMVSEYTSNDLLKDFILRKFYTPSFKHYGKPTVKNFMGIKFLKNWKLPYKSCIIVPIRYMSSFERPVDANTDKTYSEKMEWKYWGFLCIDCNSRGVFNFKYSLDIAHSFADCLYVLFSQTSFLIKEFRTI